MALDINLQTLVDKTCTLDLKGELDQVSLKHDYWPSLSATEKDKIKKNGHLKIDLSGIERADTAGLAWLINIVKHTKAESVHLSFTGVPNKLLNLADLSSARDILAP